MMLRKRGSGKGQLAGKVMSGAERDRQSMAIESGSRDGHGAGQVDAVPTEMKIGRLPRRVRITVASASPSILSVVDWPASGPGS